LHKRCSINRCSPTPSSELEEFTCKPETQWKEVSVEDGLLKELLNIPKGVKIYDMMALGYPAYQLGPRSPREINEMTHYDRYDRTKLRSEQQIKEFIKNLRKER
jgi:hypothetical protein